MIVAENLATPLAHTARADVESHMLVLLAGGLGLVARSLKTRA